MAVLVTRPDERGRQLVEMLSQSGVAALHLPLFTLEEGYELVNLPTRLNQLNAGDYVFLVSKSAVDFADKILKKTNNIWRKDLHFFTVGERTAQYFSCQSERNVRYPIRSESSEGLLELPEMQFLQGKEILILRALIYSILSFATTSPFSKSGMTDNLENIEASFRIKMLA